MRCASAARGRLGTTSPGKPPRETKLVGNPVKRKKEETPKKEEDKKRKKKETRQHPKGGTDSKKRHPQMGKTWALSVLLSDTRHMIASDRISLFQAVQGAVFQGEPKGKKTPLEVWGRD